MHHPDILAGINARLDALYAEQGQPRAPVQEEDHLGGDFAIDPDAKSTTVLRLTENEPKLRVVILDMGGQEDPPAVLGQDFESFGPLLRAVYEAGFHYAKVGFSWDDLDSERHMSHRLAIEVTEGSTTLSHTLIR